MKLSLKSVLAGLAFCGSVAFSVPATLADIAGRYDLTTNPDHKIIITEQGRVKTNITMGYQNGATVPLVFPHFLARDEFNDQWTVDGQAAYQFVNAYGQVMQCNYPVKMVAEFSPDLKALDVTLTHAQQITVDAYGRCLAIGSTQEFLSFDREAAN